MLKYSVVLALLVLSCAPTSRSGRGTYWGFTLDIRNAPPAPDVRFDHDPQLVAMPDGHVFLVDNPDYDMFQVAGTYYLANRGYWYRSDQLRGPFVSIDVHSVPDEVFKVPAERWRHHHPHWEGDSGRNREGGREGR